MKKELLQGRGNGKNNKYKNFVGGFTYLDTDEINKLKKTISRNRTCFTSLH